jgi:hypothetical protein
MIALIETVIALGMLFGVPAGIYWLVRLAVRHEHRKSSQQ